MGRTGRIVAVGAVVAVLAGCTGLIGDGGVIAAAPPVAPAGPTQAAPPVGPTAQHPDDLAATVAPVTTPDHRPTSPGAEGGGEAVRVLAGLPVRERETGGYDRDLFGQRWSDDVDVAGGHNGCDTRNDILRRDLDLVVSKPGTRDCVVASGSLLDPYTGVVIDFVRGPDSDRVQIDHVVALSDAWAKGGRTLTPQQRTDFANDPLNLLAVSGPVNQAKGNGDAADWLPPAPGSHCAYVARQIAVKDRYGLWVTAVELSAMATVLASCPEQPLPLA